MNASDVARRHELAFEVIREAGAFALGAFADRDHLKVSSKGLHDIVTETDRQVEALIRKRVRAAFPDDGFLGEETGPDGLTDGMSALWVVDPIDGTSEFARGTRNWCHVIAFVADAVVQFGVVFDPNADELFDAALGMGSTLNGLPISVSPAVDLESGVVTVEASARTNTDDLLLLLRRLIDAGGSFSRSGSGALALCYVACGRSLGFVELHMYPWDCLAALLIITEAGGTVNDFLAAGSLVGGGPVVAGPPQLFDQLRSLMPIS